MSAPIGIHLIFGSNQEPFLEAALRSVEWADYVVAINTAPDDQVAVANEVTVRRTVPAEKLRLEHLRMNPFDFAKARNKALSLADDGDWVLILDADDVHYPELEAILRSMCDRGPWDLIIGHFWHLIAYKDLWGGEPHREFCFRKTPETRFTKSVHEGLEHPRAHTTVLPGYHYVHYGYIKPPREIFKRWKLYSQLEGDPNHYNGRNPDDALEGWTDNTQPFWREHPPTVQQILESYPTAPRSARAMKGVVPCNVGLVMLTWNDAENLELCLKTLALTRQPFELVVVDNSSTDASPDLINQFCVNHPGCYLLLRHTEDEFLSLTEALNIGFGHFEHRDDIDYIGWIHPDMVFERDTWLECLRHCLDTHPDIVKVGAWELDTPRPTEPVSGNSQCYLVRKTALQQVGLFDERFLGCGGYEDWEHNHRLMQVGKVMIWPDAIIRHNAMGTRSRHDNVPAAIHNSGLYTQLTGLSEAVC